MLVLALVCTNPQNPFTNPKSAAIVADSSLTSLKDSVAAFTSVPCTVSVYLPGLIDSFFVTRSIGSQVDTAIASGKVTAATFAFSLPVLYPGSYTIKVRIVKTDKTADSLTRTFIVYSPYTTLINFVLPQTDSLRYHREYACSCSISHPELADSVLAHLIYGSTDTVLVRTKAAASLSFGFTVPTVGAFSIRVNVTLLGSGVDSVTKGLIGYILTPAVTPLSVSYHVILPADSFTVWFTATAPDSNLRLAYTWIDTAVGQAQKTVFSSLKPFLDSISRTVNNATLLNGLKAPIVFHTYAIDADSLVSPVASCTLHVTDTTKPTIRLLVPDTTVAVSALPVTIKAVVTDLDGINTVAFNGSSMKFAPGAGDTAVDSVSSIDTGTAKDSIVAIDNAGNRTALLFPLTYHGKKLYPPFIRDLSRATTEGHAFDSLYLDTCVILTDTSIKAVAAYKRDSLSWIITDSSGAQIAVSGTHRIMIPFPEDSSFFGTIKLTFKVFVTNTPTLYDTKQPSFFVTQANFPPVITLASDQCFKVLRTDTIFLDTITTAHDPNDALSSLNWSFSKGNHFKVDSVYSSRLLAKVSESAGLPIVNPIIPIFLFTRRIVIDAISAADTSYYGTDSLTFTVKDPGGLVASKKIYFTRPIGFCLFHL